ncbi:phosphomevalonate kinase [Microbacterium protaetiae]|uniref:phosphomevalonate kinase n=1 Tax=Microbacterium protaetiae TaxID=2509458 RepID=A0A4P6EEB1_9MICO|nr:phosphomevalonate kinase [Microbacterium protaetiae]QAY60494.1 phosphomevalonate kinase [Microbacterium protaetiae]
MIREQAPGKLFIAGEYAVVEPGEPSVLVAVDRHITVEVEPADTRGSISSDQYGRAPLLWTRDDGVVVLDQDHAPYDYVLSALGAVEQLAAARGIPPLFCDIRISSQLDDVSGRKFGLGSSAAVTVATVRALDRLYGLELTPMQLFKLALIATVRVSPAASGGDVAASAFGGWIAYSAPDRAWVRSEAETQGVAALLDQDWPALSVHRLPAPTGLRLLVGWTGQPASTERLVGSVQHRKPAGESRYREFVDDSRAAVEQLVDALQRRDAAGTLHAIRLARTALGDLARHAGLQIETPALTALCEIATAAGAAAKSSGAGGGDCGIVLAPPEADIHRMLTEWELNDIRHLDLKVYDVQGAIREQ